MLPEQFVEHLVTVAGGGEDALGARPAGSGVGAGLEILTQDIIFKTILSKSSSVHTPRISG